MAFVADVFDAILIDANGDTIATTTLQTGNLDVSVQEQEIRGGKGNALLGLLHVSRDIVVDLSDAAFRYEWMAKQLGQSIVTGAGVAYAMPKFYTASGTAPVKITLDEEPLSTGHEMKIYKQDGTPITTFTVNASDVEFSSGVADGDLVEVRTYKYATAATTQTINIDSSVFAKGCKLILETIEISGDEIPLFKVQYQFESTVPTGNFQINTSSERTAQAQNFQLKVLKPETSTIVGKIVRIPLS